MTTRVPSIWHSATVIFSKETRDGLRDWRAILMALLVPVMGPLMVIWIFFLLADISEEPEHVTLPTTGYDNAPGLTSWLAQNGTTFLDAPKNPRESVRNSQIKMALLIPDDYQKKVESGQPVTIELITNSENLSEGAAAGKIKRLIQAYGGQIGNLRLLARGINPEVATPLLVREVDAADGNPFTRQILRIVPMFVALAAFLCSMMLAVDVTAGERERGSIESLLLNPNPRSAFVLGKYLTAVVFSTVGLFLTLTGFLGTLSYLPVEELGITFFIDSGTVLGLVATVLPLALMASGLMILVSSLARSYKESQATLSLITLLPVVPMFVENVGPIRTWMYTIPIFSQQRLLVDVLAGEIPSILHFTLSGSVSLIIAAIAVWLTTRLFHKESFIFGR